jgi:hypothetical protein
VAAVELRHDRGSSLSAWLLDGRHPALLFSGEQLVDAAR